MWDKLKLKFFSRRIVSNPPKKENGEFLFTAANNARWRRYSDDDFIGSPPLSKCSFAIGNKQINFFFFFLKSEFLVKVERNGRVRILSIYYFFFLLKMRANRPRWCNNRAGAGVYAKKRCPRKSGRVAAAYPPNGFQMPIPQSHATRVHLPLETFAVTFYS